jgi:hypothetical protein
MTAVTSMPELAVNFICFVLGVIAVYAWNCVKARFLNRRNGISSQPSFGRRGMMLLAVAFIIFGSISVAVQTEKTHNEVRAISMETEKCYRQFSEALNARSAISQENEKLSRIQRAALADNQVALKTWLDQLLSPPAEIAALPPNSPPRRDWGISVTNKLNETMAVNNRIITESNNQQLANDKEREEHPLPQPTCGAS